VISIGNLTLGGSGKTPLAAAIARMLLEMGERPAILSRGYARRSRADGVVVVSDGRQLLADVDRSGDEPFMLARMIPQAAVLVCSSRYVAGRLAESRLGCTVHILDDGFQHFELMRDIDLLVAPDALDDVRTLPAGRFREPLDAASTADALLVETAAEGRESVAASAAARLNVPLAFEFTRRLAGAAPDQPAFAFAGIARPERFFADLERSGWRITGRRSFRDHHHYSRRDLEAVVAEARQSGAQVILTTEKDAVRLKAGNGELPIVPIPLEISIEARFTPWLAERLRSARPA
jgi:tetraacyldisaccharide 4'-kinase